MRDEALYLAEDGTPTEDPSEMAEERHRGHGGVRGCDDEELADPGEVEEQVVLESLGPILAYPVEERECPIRSGLDEADCIDCGPSGAVDVAGPRPSFDKARHKADKLDEQLRNHLTMLSIIRKRLSQDARCELLERLQSDRMDPDDISDGDARAYAKWYLRAKRLQQRIRGLRDLSG